MPFVTERWLGGMLTNFNTVRKSVKKMQSIEKMLEDGTLRKRYQKRTPDIDPRQRKNGKSTGWYRPAGPCTGCFVHGRYRPRAHCLAEAKRLGITTFGMVDTNSDPNKVDFAIPANDDATKSIAIITNYITAAIAEGLQNVRQLKMKK